MSLQSLPDESITRIFGFILRNTEEGKIAAQFSVLSTTCKQWNRAIYTSTIVLPLLQRKLSEQYLTKALHPEILRKRVIVYSVKENCKIRNALTMHWNEYFGQHIKQGDWKEWLNNDEIPTSFITKADFRYYGITLDDLLLLQKKCPNLKELMLNGEFMPIEIFQRMHFPLLTSFCMTYLSTPKDKDYDFSIFSKRHSNLEKLVLFGSSLSGKELRSFLSHTPNVQKLVLNLCHKIPSKVMKICLASLQQLHTFAFEISKEDREICNLENDDVQFVSRIKKINLGGHKFIQPFVVSNQVISLSLVDAELVSLEGESGQLEELYLNKTKGLTEENMISFLRGASNLRVLDLSFTSYSAKVIQVVAKSCPKLERIFLRGLTISEQALRMLCKKCLELRELDCTESKGLTEKGIENITRCPKLQKLSLASCTIDGGLEFIEGCVTLREVDLRNSGPYTKFSYLALKEQAGLKIKDEGIRLNF